MSGKLSLKETERRVFQSAFQDGLIDIAIGCVFVTFVVAPYLSPYLGDFWSSAQTFSRPLISVSMDLYWSTNWR